MAPAALGAIVMKIAEYKDYKEIEQCFEGFKIITSNLTWDNNELLLLVHEAFHFKHSKGAIHDLVLKTLAHRI